MTKAQTAMIRAAAERPSTADQWRRRMDRWLDAKHPRTSDKTAALVDWYNRFRPAAMQRRYSHS